MGLCHTKIYFQNSIPPLAEINEQFHKQTGYDLWVNASLNLSQLGTPIEVSQSLVRDFGKVVGIQKSRTELEQNYPTDYEKQAQVRDMLNSLDHIQYLSFGTWFYNIDFQVKGNGLVIEAEVGQFYAVESLTKVLIELGGSFDNTQASDCAQKKWRKLKPWDKYKWYNRPRK